HRRITAAGGINIAAGEPVKVPRVSAEWVLERNPDIIVYSYLKARKSAKVPSPEEMKKIRDEIMNEPGLRETKAVKEGKVYIIDTRLITGPRSIIGLLYFAKWFHPELFKDIDPEAVHKEMLQKFYGMELEGTWVYPEQ
ncbi:MAG: ABC transporter substrate-binding protein, partial [Deltaproteobacteria bacterium]|nr:ABC transporter substrate-binding protein [Deltaproteobacteria bacterium]